MTNSIPDPLFDIREQVIVITGGGGVLPGAMARALAARGARIALLNRTLPKAEAIAEQIRADGGNCIALQADVTDSASIERAAQETLDAFGRVDHLINGAGGQRPGAIAMTAEAFFDLHADELRAVIDLNLMGTVLPSQVFGKHLVAQKQGSILNVSSMAALRPLTRAIGYGAAKAGIDNFTRWLAVTLAREISPALRVNAIAPGFFLGDQNRSMLVNPSGEPTPRGQTIIAHTPMGRFGEPADLLGTVIWLLSPGAAFVTGVVIPVDGGFSAFSGVWAPCHFEMPTNMKYLAPAEIEEIIASGLDTLPLANKRVLVIVPDGTRTMPLPLFVRLLVKHLRPRAREITFLIALGTHPPMSEDAILKRVGMTREEWANDYADVKIVNHAWQDPNALITLGEISSQEIAALTNGLFVQPVPIRLNRMVVEYDHVLICGPVFPHEVVGFSGGNKYFFPGIAGQDIIDFTHWLGALLTSYEIIGTKDTPVRAVIDRAAALIPTPRHALCAVVTGEGVANLFFGTPEEAWSRAADCSALVHVRWMEQPYDRVLAVLPEMYDELWVGAKGMYKTEPVVADGGEVIIYAPHLREISVVHGALIRQIGYHVRDYFSQQWEAFKQVPWGVLAHSTHVRGIGSYENGIEEPRIQVTLATGIPQEICRAVNLGYCDPAEIDVREWEQANSSSRLLVPHAGEALYRLKVEC